MFGECKGCKQFIECNDNGYCKDCESGGSFWRYLIKTAPMVARRVNNFARPSEGIKMSHYLSVSNFTDIGQLKKLRRELKTYEGKVSWGTMQKLIGGLSNGPGYILSEEGIPTEKKHELPIIDIG